MDELCLMGLEYEGFNEDADVLRKSPSMYGMPNICEFLSNE